ncbi:hypothetical protein [Amycolatopsis plumensis]|uniref:hypothetical protein n=1 Tax=Amycolatopsis plumensis TaxID=236508 RepID=UPI003606A532
MRATRTALQQREPGEVAVAEPNIVPELGERVLWSGRPQRIAGRWRTSSSAC